MEENKIVEEKDIEEVENGTEGIKISSDVIAPYLSLHSTMFLLIRNADE